MTSRFEQLNDLISRLKVERATTKILLELWDCFFPPDYLPAPKQFIIWQDRYPLDVVEKGIRRAAATFRRRTLLWESTQLMSSIG